METQRKKEIYAICVEFGKLILSRCDCLFNLAADIIIVEDDPYYFLQEGRYVPKEDRIVRQSEPGSPEDFIASLAPSYVKFVISFVDACAHSRMHSDLIIRAGLSAWILFPRYV
jgi:aromatic amino acid aminotransferase I